MPGSVLLDVTVGIVLLYLLVALFCTAIQEWIAHLSDLRAKHLQAAIKVLLSGTKESNEDANAVLAHPLVKMLAANRDKGTGPKDPSYLPARNFADALVARLIAGSGTTGVDLTKIKAGIATIANADAKNALTAIIGRAEASETSVEMQLKAALGGIERWYDSAMDHASGWYKRKVRWMLLGIATVFTVATNADSIQVGWLLAVDSQLRVDVTAMAAKAAPPDDDLAKALGTMGKQTTELLEARNIHGGFGSLPIGWGTCSDPNPAPDPAPNPAKGGFLSKCYQHTNTSTGEEGSRVEFSQIVVNNYWVALLAKIVGLLLTALAAALGAPFWFGLLQQLNAIRAAGPKPESSTAGGAGS